MVGLGLLQLQMELNHWQDKDAQVWAKNMKPLSDLIIVRYKEYLPEISLSNSYRYA